jgi:elongation factor 1-alpha
MVDVSQNMSLITELGIAIAGSVDSGKSTFVGVITSGKLDNGDGSARVNVARHPHELQTNKTSSISSKSVIIQNKKAVTLIDLCGHDKYLKTTAYGIAGHYPDYAFLIVGANKGVLQMTRQHTMLLLSNNVPIIIIITRFDITPENIYNETCKMIENYCKNIIKTPAIFINTPYNLSHSTEIYKNDKLQFLQDIIKYDNTRQINIPVITVSNKTGYYIDFILNMINNLKPRDIWKNFDEDYNKKIVDRCHNTIIKNFISHIEPSLFINPKNNTSQVFFIDGVYNKQGIGIVLAGINRGGIINVGDILYLGPFGKEFKEVRIKSMHNYIQQKITSAYDHHRITLAISSTDKDICRKNIRKGMVLLKSKENIKENITWHFNAAITIFNHSTTLKNGYSPILQIGNVRQTGRMIYEPSKNQNRECIKSKEFAFVTFKFKQYPEYIEPYQIFAFRSGLVHGVGVVLDIIPYHKDNDARPDPQKAKNILRKFVVKK